MDFESNPPKAKIKNREIRYSSHRDAAIYTIYAHALSSRYEQHLYAHHIHGSVLAYRSGVGSNVDFAGSLFEEIRGRKNCTVICVDISGFFDNINHELLKLAIQKILNTRRLSNDWFSVFKSLTRYSFVDKRKLDVVLGRRAHAGRICSPAEFRSKVRPVIEKHRAPVGIPQGSPISGLLANTYMMNFDIVFGEFVKGHGGSYRRYSDDVAIVLPNSASKSAILMAMHTMLMHLNLYIKDSKTCETEFAACGSHLTYSGDRLQYLGFTFDGERILLRPESTKKFYERMKRNIRRYIKSAKAAGRPRGEIHQRVMIGRFTHWGDARNFVQYAYTASEKLNAPEIKRQLRRHVRIYQTYWDSYLNRIYGSPPSKAAPSPPGVGPP